MFNRQLGLVMIILVAMALAVFPAVAEEDHTETAGHAAESEHHGEGGHDFKNGLALFLGATNESGHGTEPTWGLEYGRSLSRHWSVGGLIDYAGGQQRNMVIAPFVLWKPFGSGLYLLAAPGVEYHNGRGTVEPHLLKVEAAAVDENETYFVMRFGVAYFFHVGSRYGIGPTVNLDLVDGHEVWIYGVNFEVMF